MLPLSQLYACALRASSCALLTSWPALCTARSKARPCCPERQKGATSAVSKIMMPVTTRSSGIVKPPVSLIFNFQFSIFIEFSLRIENSLEWANLLPFWERKGNAQENLFGIRSSRVVLNLQRNRLAPGCLECCGGVLASGSRRHSVLEGPGPAVDAGSLRGCGKVVEIHHLSCGDTQGRAALPGGAVQGAVKIGDNVLLDENILLCRIKF